MDIAYHQRTKRSELNFEFYESLIDMAEDCEILVAIIPGGETTEKIIDERDRSHWANRSTRECCKRYSG